jgi:hypothetical protein
VCAKCCQFLWIVHSWLPLRVCCQFLWIVHSWLPFVLRVSLDCPFLIAPSCCQFLWIALRVASFSGLSILDCPFVLPVSLDCPFLIAPSVFTNVYLFRTFKALIYSLTTIEWKQRRWYESQIYWKLDIPESQPSCIAPELFAHFMSDFRLNISVYALSGFYYSFVTYTV